MDGAIFAANTIANSNTTIIMTIPAFLEKLDQTPKAITFAETMAVMKITIPLNQQL
jgi:hypothetical protein